MTNEVMALGIIFVFIITATIIGMLPGMKEKMNLEEWAIGGRGFGKWMSWFVLAGEIYTAFAFLGASGWAYAKGGPTFYLLGYCSLAYMASYWILPAVSPIGKKFNLMTQPDFIQHRYSDKWLGIVVACFGVAFLIPYLQLQLTGLGLIVETCSYGLIGRNMAMLIAFFMVATFVALSGLKGVATSAILKDIVMIVAVLFFGLYLPYHYFGGLGEMFEAIDAAKPGFLALPGGTAKNDVSWFMSTLVLTSLGFYMWPHIFANSYSAKSPNILRHNAVFLPLYQICMLFPMLVGFCALMILTPALKTPDMAYMILVQKTFPGWILGMVGGAGALACMIPAADLLLTISMLFSRNVVGKGLNIQDNYTLMAHMAKIVVVAATGIALLLAMFAPKMLVELLLTGYSGVSQFFPMIVLGLFWKKATRTAAWVSLLTGETIVFVLILGKMDPFPVLGMNLNAGFIALAVNTSVYVLASLATFKETDSQAWKCEEA
jgi:SSS family solute:Na+ symporter